MIVVIGGEKGGIGKSTVTVNLAVCAVRAGLSTIIVDADKIGSSSQWAADRDEAGIEPYIPVVRLTGKAIKKDVEALDEKYDLVLVDTPARDSKELRTSLFAADICLLPIQCSQFDVNTLVEMDEIVEETKEVNPDLEPFVILTMRSTNAASKDVENTKELVKEAFPRLPVLDHGTCFRMIYREVVPLGKGVIESANAKAAGEISELFNEFCKVGGIKCQLR